MNGKQIRILFLLLLTSSVAQASFFKKMADACRRGVGRVSGTQSKVHYSERNGVWYRSYFLFDSDLGQKLVAEKQRRDGTWVSHGHYEWQQPGTDF